MVENVRANQVCERILKFIKESNLNYLINETPYSSFVTIRKRFTKGFTDSSEVTFVSDDVSSLQNECQRLKSDLELCKNQNN